MSLFDCLRPRWKHTDPAVRQDAVRGLVDPQLLADIATNDASDDVRRAAIEALNDQRCLEQIASAGSELALAAFAKVSDKPAIARLAQSAESVAVRQRAVEKIDDVAVLRCVACADPNAAVRAMARAKCTDDSISRVHLCAVLSRLQVAEHKVEQVVEFCGTMSEICRALTRDPRFFINGSVSADEEDGAAQLVDPTQAPWTKAGFQTREIVARFVAQTRPEPSGQPSASEPLRYFLIKVWRVGEDLFNGVAEEKQLAATSDAAVWSRASSSGPLEESASTQDAAVARVAPQTAGLAGEAATNR